MELKIAVQKLARNGKYSLQRIFLFWPVSVLFHVWKEKTEGAVKDTWQILQVQLLERL